jgi:hypothetical protein
MTNTARGAVFALSVTVVALGLGCSSSPPAPNSFTEVYQKVLQPTCSNAFCHYAGISIRLSALDMSSQTAAYWNLVDAPTLGAVCGSMGTRVVPGDPEHSIMYLKVSQATPPCGNRMPADITVLERTQSAVFSGTPLTADQQQLIFNWIKDGAQNN